MSTQGEAPVETHPTQPVEEKKRVAVFQLPAGVSRADDLRDLCKEYGSITDVEFFAARGPKPAFGFVTFKTSHEAENAILSLRQRNLGNGPLKVNFAENRQKQDPAAKKKKGKKPMTSLVTLTPKNQAVTVVQEQQQQQATVVQTEPKKTWDLNAAQQKQAAQQQNKRGPGPKGPRGNKQPAGQAQTQPAQTTGTPNPNAAQKKPVVPAQQAQPVAPAQTTQAAPQVQAAAQGQPGNKQPKKKQNKKPAQPPVPVAQQAPVAPAPVAQQAPVVHQTAVTAAQPAPASQPAQPAQPKPKVPKAKKPVVFQLNVIDPKTGVVVHSVPLTQGQYEHHISPLVRK